MNNQKVLQGLVLFFASLLGFVFLFHLLIPSAQPVLMKKEYKSSSSEAFHYVAIGDSLTQGVGDTSNQGGFVPLVAQSLVNDYGYQLSYDNFGVSGNTSAQILKRMKGQSEIQESLEKADVMTLTVGGNDLRKTILDNFSHLELETFDKPIKSYQKRLVQIIKEARKNNPDLPIYVLGIYNPFYLNFPELTEFQTVVDNWNAVTKETTADFDQVYFIPINDLLYKGLNEEEGIDQAIDKTSNVINEVLYKEDNFHPNGTGYEIMKRAVLEKMSETKANWKK